MKNSRGPIHTHSRIILAAGLLLPLFSGGVAAMQVSGQAPARSSDHDTGPTVEVFLLSEPVSSPGFYQGLSRQGNVVTLEAREVDARKRAHQVPGIKLTLVRGVIYSSSFQTSITGFSVWHDDAAGRLSSSLLVSSVPTANGGSAGTQEFQTPGSPGPTTIPPNHPCNWSNAKWLAYCGGCNSSKNMQMDIAAKDAACAALSWSISDANLDYINDLAQAASDALTKFPCAADLEIGAGSSILIGIGKAIFAPMGILVSFAYYNECMTRMLTFMIAKQQAAKAKFNKTIQKAFADFSTSMGHFCVPCPIKGDPPPK